MFTVNLVPRPFALTSVKVKSMRTRLVHSSPWPNECLADLWCMILFRISYIHLMANYKMCVQLRDQSRAFFRGFREFIQHDWLNMFSGPELQKLISGDSTTLDVADLRFFMNYQSYLSGKRTVLMFSMLLMGKRKNVDI